MGFRLRGLTCKYAADCLGELRACSCSRSATISSKDRVALEVKRLLGRDFQRIAHALKVAPIKRKRSLGSKRPKLPSCCALPTSTSSLEGEDPGNRKVILDTLGRLGAGPELIRGTMR